MASTYTNLTPCQLVFLTLTSLDSQGALGRAFVNRLADAFRSEPTLETAANVRVSLWADHFHD
jgi:hypothetical protein